MVAGVSEQPIDDGTSAPDEASSGATSDEFGNLSVEDDPGAAHPGG